MNLTPEELDLVNVTLIDQAGAFALNPQILACVILQESGGDRYAHRYEPAFYMRYLANKKATELPGYVPVNATLMTEKYDRACSWGLCQIMGETARELNFGGDFLTALCDIENGIAWGARFLSKCYNLSGGEDVGALQHYNGGGNALYASQVLQRVSDKEWARLLEP